MTDILTYSFPVYALSFGINAIIFILKILAMIAPLEMHSDQVEYVEYGLHPIDLDFNFHQSCKESLLQSFHITRVHEFPNFSAMLSPLQSRWPQMSSSLYGFLSSFFSSFSFDPPQSML